MKRGFSVAVEKLRQSALPQDVLPAGSPFYFGEPVKMETMAKRRWFSFNRGEAIAVGASIFVIIVAVIVVHFLG